MLHGGKILQVFEDADLRCSHDGLGEIALKSKIKLKELEEGEYVVFFNTTRTHLKIAAAHNVIAHSKMEHGRFYDLGCIQNVVRAFHNTGRIEYDEALKERLEELLRRKHG
jgi:hypothetical protein